MGIFTQMCNYTQLLRTALERNAALVPHRKTGEAHRSRRFRLAPEFSGADSDIPAFDHCLPSFGHAPQHILPP